ncbi:NAD(P)-dependent oxidoreductase [Paraburkholderia caballeronis]|uniref:3-hydroxyisobutyrate dehydrogenase n=1 Tax=Paraburkholderia caballeronis TaxID=416943 RepID=A0A1H7W2B4_9BURK|nr:NAD(P)-dependent oxidoreductase [Paraburkholderia caballeronis]PXW14541.1 3-hydroxyisobutyrate dehydrogenase-like beta-hydroxyacid dehydrogenase [Paraburkholderia caballeronis]PXW92901.1 3-hydroxyisobutyrate dehydrogenase-like beta-hydroxyacid dehydrogenase [Paraburkholderia caballeronis]RAJ86639.1 3-hydroxyisobutyrate dehydrogenase-like beta-hydroxyacid dehydrogenase [Paraburkholderia caballeronis]SEB53555.1 3-hydroxyisobutyrate dehydrogenase [Paraburkholderia caballeronis]SEM15712.1 3-hyd
MDIGFIGLGEMGGAIVANLLKAGHRVRVWNRTAERARPLADAGAEVVATPADAFAGDAVFSMLADDAALREVVDASLLEHVPRGIVHVNMATISVALAEQLAREHAERGLHYVAAPVLGRPDVAKAAKLTIVAGGPAEALDRVQPLFDAIGQKTWRIGSLPQQANVMKLAANFMLASAVETLGEAAALLSGHGVAMRDFLDVVTGGPFPGPVYQGYGTMIAEQRYEPAMFKARLGLKDVRLALAAADAVSTPLPVASAVRDSLLEAVAHGDGELDFAVLGKVALRRAGR